MIQHLLMTWSSQCSLLCIYMYSVRFYSHLEFALLTTMCTLFHCFWSSLLIHVHVHFMSCRRLICYLYLTSRLLIFRVHVTLTFLLLLLQPVNLVTAFWIRKLGLKINILFMQQNRMHVIHYIALGQSPMTCM